MNINIAHVAVYASDLEATKDFYAKVFQWQMRGAL